MKVKNPLSRQLIPFLPCLIVVGALILLEKYLGISDSESRTNLLHYLRSIFFYYNSLAVYLFVLVLALFSFRNLYNFKILLTGFLFLMTGIFSLTYFTSGTSSVLKRENFQIMLYLFYSLDLLVVGLVPSYLPRITTQIFLVIFIVLKGFLLAGSWLFLGSAEITLFTILQSPTTLLVINAMIAALSVWISCRREDYYGGAIAGLIVVFTVSYYIERQFLVGQRIEAELLEILLMQSVPVILAIFVIANWVISLSHRALYDPLMNIYSRRYCDSIIAGRSLSLGKPFSIALLDIDNFKDVNDLHGHTVGDTVLHQLALKIRDIALPRGITCRYGGDEIIVFFPNTTLDYAKKVIQNVLISISQFKISTDKEEPKAPIWVTISGGLASGEKGRDEAKKVLEAADQALYLSKQNGRNRVTVSGEHQGML